ncbi:MAG: RNA polymerase sigma-70 factor [Dysgonamonadaceae bacterium]|jgi:RNA polymerase sigma-70 factor (ECF subfamily)|nr:RNA polymerase sigma-70 factor [Dysgonamonadaceae bacterium]
MNKESVFLQKLNDKKLEAYRTLYDDYYAALVVYVSSITGSDEAAEDIVQELFVSIWEKQVVFTSYPAFKSYLYRFVKNAAFDYLRHQDVENRYAGYITDESSDEEVFDETEMHREEEYRLLFKAIDELPARCREIFLMSLEGKKNREIAVELQISIDTVKTQKLRAMRHLRQRLHLLFLFLLSTYTLI